MGEEERREFLAWYESWKLEPFDKRRVLEKYCQGKATVLSRRAESLGAKSCTYVI